MSNEPVIVRVHGTFAADEADVGEAWWQEGSKFQLALSRHLGSKYHFARPFHWSGANSERDRRLAAMRLASELRVYEAKGIPYHLLGHSHGGSVIWWALQLLAAFNFKGPRSWITVATPFLTFKSGAYKRVCLLTLVMGLAFLVLLSSEPPGWLSFLVLAQSPTWLIWLAMAALFLAYFPFSDLYSLPLFIKLAVWLRRERAKKLTSLWMGIRSNKDEVVTALQTVAGLKGDDLRASDTQPSSREDTRAAWTFFGGGSGYQFLAQHFAIVHYLKAAMRNLTMPIVRRLVRDWIHGFAFGRDVYAARLAQVDLLPYPGLEPQLQTMPAEEEKRALNKVDQVLAEQSRTVRELLGDSATLGLKAFTARAEIQLDTKALMHCVYFEQDWVIRQVAAHIRRHGEDGEVAREANLYRGVESQPAEDRWRGLWGMKRSTAG